MGAINVKHTGSGADIALSSDGTSLLLDGTAIGGGGGDPDLYADNWDGTATKPSATGVNTIAIGQSAVAGSSDDGIAIGRGANAGTSTQNMAIGAFSACGDAAFAVAFGREAKATGGNSMALGKGLASNTSSLSAQITNNTTTYGATGANSIAMGYQAKAAGQSSAMGYGAVADGSYALALGVYAKASASSSIAISAETAGYYTEALQNNSVAIGTRAKANIRGKFAFANGAFGDNGDAQLGIFSLRSDTTDATAEALTTDKGTAGTTNQIVLPNNSAYAFHGTIVARQKASEGTASAAWKVEGLIRREGSAGTTVLVNSATTVLDNTPAWGMALTANTSHGGLAITVTGAASTNIRWVATVNTSEVTYS
jgi:trimeric autotransporter adhesin